MAVHKLLPLAQDLEWVGCELEYCGQKHAQEGFPETGPVWAEFLQKQQGVLSTADKIEREIKGAIRFNPTSLVGIEFPLEAAFNSIAALLDVVEEIRQTAVMAVNELPAKVRNFTRMIELYITTVGVEGR